MRVCRRATNIAILLCFLWPEAASAAGSPSFCKGAEVSLNLPVGLAPIRVARNLIQAGYATTGWIQVTNTSQKEISEIKILARYEEDSGVGSVAVEYFRTIFPGTKSMTSLWKSGLRPGGTTQIVGTSVRILRSCPAQGEITFLEIIFSDSSRTVFGDPSDSDPVPSKLRIQKIDSEVHLQTDSAYLVRIQIRPDGSVENVSLLVPRLGALPLELKSTILGWMFTPAQKIHSGSSAEVLAAVRILRSQCQVDTCPFPFLSEDIGEPFILIDILACPLSEPRHRYEVFVGGSPVKDDGVRYDENSAGG